MSRVSVIVAIAAFLFTAHSEPTTRPSADAASQRASPAKVRIIFLHHSTGMCIWDGGIAEWFDSFNRNAATQYEIVERAFPAESPYGWNNYPFDYWNLWVRHAGERPFKGEPTLEMLTREFDVVVFKHCFPVSAIEPDTGTPDIGSDDKRIENYQLQYNALRQKLRAFPKTKFIVWTGAALLESETDKATALRAKTFFEWVRSSWDERGDNIFLWDFRALETEGGLYLKPDASSGDAHPNPAFSRRVAPLFCGRIVDVVMGRGDDSPLIGRLLSPQVAREAGSSDSGPSHPTTSRSDRPIGERVRESPKVQWIVDDAERADRLSGRWEAGVRYVPASGGHVIRLDFSKAREADWGEYGKQRIISTRRPAKNDDISSFEQFGFRVRCDRSMELVITLITRSDALSRDASSYFGFSGYVQAAPGEWQHVVFDLSAMELGMEGDRAYEAEGKPMRPMRLSEIQIVTNKKHENAIVTIDDIVFSRSTSPADKKAVR